jgi:pimeloyl-ACP methyl ester carboxylesterase
LGIKLDARSNAVAQVQTIRLKDGRTLGFYEYGDPAGTPLVYTTGTPADGQAGFYMDALGRDMGIRVISIDKPGYGVSTLVKNRSLLDYPADVAAVADHLGIDRFAAAGESGGGPHVLALAHGIPERLTIAINLAGMGPGDGRGVTDGMKKSNVRLFKLAASAPWLLALPLGAMGKALRDPVKAQKYMDKQVKEMPAEDIALMDAHPELIEALMKSAAGAFRNGPAGAIEEMKMFAKPWGFSISSITAPVVLFHGEKDVNVPIAIARSVAAQLPNCDVRVFADAGHSVAVPHLKEVLQCVLDAA